MQVLQADLPIKCFSFAKKTPRQISVKVSWLPYVPNIGHMAQSANPKLLPLLALPSSATGSGRAQSSLAGSNLRPKLQIPPSPPTKKAHPKGVLSLAERVEF